MNETGFQYTYRRVKAVFLREWKLILLVTLLSTFFAIVANLLLRKGPVFKGQVYMMQTAREKEVSVLTAQVSAPQERKPVDIDVLRLKIKFPEFYAGLKDTSIMYEILYGRISGITALKPGVYTEKDPGVVKCPCSKKFKVVVYDTVGLWKRLSKGNIRLLEDREGMNVLSPVVFFVLEHKSPDRRWAMKAADASARWIIKKHLEEKKQKLLRQRNTIARLMEFYKQEITHFAGEIERFKKQMKYPELTEEKVLLAMGELKEREMALKELKDLLQKSPEDTVFVDVGDVVINDLQRQRLSLLLEMRGVETTKGRNHPQFRILEGKLHALNNLILKSVDRSLEYVKEQMAYYKRVLPVVLKEQSVLLTIQRNLENAEDFYIVLGQKLNDTDVQLGSLVPDISILGEPTVRKVGIYSRSRFAALLGFLIGLVIGISLAFFRDLTTDVLLDEDMLPFPKEKVVSLPTFSRFDLLPYQMVRLKEVDSSSPALNEFRKLLFRLGMFDELKEIVAITSTQTGEGKTFISANLAATAALSGIPVLLIDGDIRVRGLSELFGLADAEGYANGHYDPYKVNDYLYVLPVGRTNEDHLMVFRRMLNNIGDLLQRFRVVLDLPPVTVSPEIKLLHQFAVRYVLVVRYNYTHRSHLKKIDLKPDLVIFNQVGRASTYYSRYYGRYGRKRTGWLSTVKEKAFSLFRRKRKS